MHAARNEFINAESPASLKKALKSKIYPKGDDIIEGDMIYYKQNIKKSNPVWHGPSKVVAANGKKLFVDNGARLKTVNRDDSVRRGEELWKFDSEKHVKEQEMESSIRRALGKVEERNERKVISDNETSSEEEDESDDDDHNNAPV